MAVWDADRGVWDTGLHENSKILVRLYPDPNARKEVLKGLNKFVVNPVVVIKGDGVLNTHPAGEDSFGTSTQHY
jgi:hypothetical protein